MSVPTVFALAVGGGLAANFGLTRLDSMHKVGRLDARGDTCHQRRPTTLDTSHPPPLAQGCADVCTVFQFAYGFTSALLSPAKRRFLKASERKLSLKWHLLFAIMFCIGPYLGNMAKSITKEDFTPVFLVVRSCGASRRRRAVRGAARALHRPPWPAPPAPPPPSPGDATASPHPSPSRQAA